MKSLLDKMTIIEKLGQLVQIPPFFYIKDLKDELYGPAVELGLTKEEIYMTGSVLGIGSPEEMIEVQKKYLENNRLGIPLLFMADIIHGYETIFPIPLALASSFNEELVKEVARVSALEASTSGINVTFSPMADLVRDPRWGRVMESFGEDPYLNEIYSKKMVEGYQGKSISDDSSIASCVKHFAAYGLSEAGRDYNTVDLSEYELKQNYLSGYKGAIDAGAKMVMTSFNLFNGIPATMNEHLLKNILRKDLGFNGVVISDYNGVKETIIHGLSSNNKEAAINSFNASLDIEMVTGTYMLELEAEFLNNNLDIKLLDEAVLRVLNLKKELGLFENPFKNVSRAKHDLVVLSKEHLEIAKKVADESVVLLKNSNQTLPLKEESRLYFMGSNVHERNLNGAWSWHGKRDVNKTLFESFKDYKISNNIDSADVIIYFGGEKFNESGEAKSKTNIDFSLAELAEIKKLKQFGKKIVLVIAAGRPLVLTEVEKEVDAILYTWFLGTKAADAIKDILVGKINPSGKLPMTFPRALGQVPIYYNSLKTGRPKNSYDNEYTSVYIDMPNSPLYPFGYGLSYSNFKLENIKVNKHEFKEKDEIEISLDITNNSTTSGHEVIQIYVSDLFAKVSRPMKELKGFKKVFVKSNETKKVLIKLDIEAFKYYDANLVRRVDDGDFKLYVSTSSDNVIKEFTIKYVGGTKLYD